MFSGIRFEVGDYDFGITPKWNVMYGERNLGTIRPKNLTLESDGTLSDGGSWVTSDRWGAQFEGDIEVVVAHLITVDYQNVVTELNLVTSRLNGAWGVYRPEMLSLVRTEGKIPAIKRLREISGMELREAKDQIEAWMADEDVLPF